MSRPDPIRYYSLYLLHWVGTEFRKPKSAAEKLNSATICFCPGVGRQGIIVSTCKLGSGQKFNRKFIGGVWHHNIKKGTTVMSNSRYVNIIPKFPNSGYAT